MCDPSHQRVSFCRREQQKEQKVKQKENGRRRVSRRWVKRMSRIKCWKRVGRLSRRLKSHNCKELHKRNQTRSSSRASNRNRTTSRPGRGRGNQGELHHRPPTPGKSPANQNNSLFREKVSETDQEVWFYKDCCQIYGQKGHWMRVCRNSYNCGSSPRYQKVCPIQVLEESSGKLREKVNGIRGCVRKIIWTGKSLS